MPKKNCPCKDCVRRRFNCHAMCDTYKAWKAELEKQNMASAAEKQQTPELCRSMVKYIWRNMKWR